LYVYQKALAAEGAVRLGLDGMPAGEVTPEQRAMAEKKLARLKAKKTMR
jgi:sRNA-binding protein